MSRDKKHDDDRNVDRALSPVVSTLLHPDPEEERIARARRAAGYIHPHAFKHSSMVESVKMIAEVATMKKFEQKPLTSSELQRRVQTARRTAECIAYSMAMGPIPSVRTSPVEMAVRLKKLARQQGTSLTQHH
mmetsp:Transcript_1430/g.2667  ORF Transcript_1430/g.2667 Transcript_1430/m.2667 type:complete len:133 (+) Transcript_1430:216-614(+)